MHNEELRGDIHELFAELHERIEKIISSSKTYQAAMEEIINLIVEEVTAESEGYVVDLYMNLVKEIRADELYFQNPYRLHKFYKLDLRNDLYEKYRFDVTSLDIYKKGIDFKEVHQLYISAGAAAGTFAVGGILKFVLAGTVNIPLAVIIAGAVAAACVSYFVAVPIKNQREFCRAVDEYLFEMENELLDWLEDVTDYFFGQVRTLYTSSGDKKMAG